MTLYPSPTPELERCGLLPSAAPSIANIRHASRALAHLFFELHSGDELRNCHLIGRTGLGGDLVRSEIESERLTVELKEQSHLFGLFLYLIDRAVLKPPAAVDPFAAFGVRMSDAQSEYRDDKAAD